MLCAQKKSQHSSYIQGGEDIQKMLFKKKKIKLYAQTGEGKAPIHVVITECQNETVKLSQVKVLFKYSAESNIPEFHKGSIMYSIETKQKDIVKELWTKIAQIKNLKCYRYSEY